MTARAESPSITACTNGPLLVRGDVELQSAAGRPIERHRRTIALCRCGLSSIKPFCDGAHKTSGFRTDDADDDAESRAGRT